MKVAVMTDIEKVEIIERDIPKIGDDDLLIRVEYVGVCGSDLHYYEHGRIGDFIVKYPFVLGHEVAGTVAEVGKNVTTHKIGDRVALEPQITDPNSNFSKQGLYNLDENVIFFATPPVDGTFQEYVSHPAELCFILPENVSTLEGAMIEPLSVGLHAANKGEAGLGQTAMITGTGCIGLTALLSLKAMGVSKIIVQDLSDNRLAKAKELGADYCINSSKDNVKEIIDKITENRGIDLGIETSGSQKAVETLMRVVKKGSTIVLVGYSASGEMTLPMSMALDKELTFKGIFRYRNTYPVAINALSKGQIDVKNLVTDIFEFDDIQNALQESLHNRDKIVKAAIKISK